MLYSYNLSQEAEDDLFEAFTWYEEQKKGLGDEFLKSLDKAYKSILQYPNSYQIRYKRKVRAFAVDRFPFLILYVVEKTDINIISIFNTNRNPKSWKKRV
jgi:toxin ParE1/3/4